MRVLLLFWQDTHSFMFPLELTRPNVVYWNIWTQKTGGGEKQAAAVR